MPNNRDYPRAARFNSELRSVLMEVLRSALIRDPRVSGRDLTITSVDVTPDLSHAHVWVSSLSEDEVLSEAVQGLNHAANKLRHEIKRRMIIRHVPELHFAVDRATREGDRISALIRTAVERDEAHAKARSDQPKPE